MRRRVSLTVLGAWVVVLGVGPAMAAEPVQGRDYVAVVRAEPPDDPKKIVVKEFFSYACPHCFAFAPALRAWEPGLAKDVVLQRESVAVGRAPWVLPAKLYYALRSMGKDKELDAAVFDALHVERVGFATVADVAKWASSKGVDADALTSALNSFSVNSFALRADQESRAIRLPSVPSLLIDGKYLVAIVENGDFAAQLGVVDALIAKARQERGLPAP
jgi:protein dithiol oxidoreductase (disulfide-forming)